MGAEYSGDILNADDLGMTLSTGYISANGWKLSVAIHAETKWMICVD